MILRLPTYTFRELMNLSQFGSHTLNTCLSNAGDTYHANDSILDYIFHNQPKSGAGYEPVIQRLLPLDEKWMHEFSALQWPTKNIPGIVGKAKPVLMALIREYLFVSLFKACTESLASENTSRLEAMQRADKNIGDLLDSISHKFHRLRQSSIDEELFDVVSGFEALKDDKN